MQELQTEFAEIRRVGTEKLKALQRARNFEINDAKSRFNEIMTDLQQQTKEKKDAFQMHCIKELIRIRNRIQNAKKNPQTFAIKAINSESNPTISISRNMRYSLDAIEGEIQSVFHEWQNEIGFSVKRVTRTTAKHKKGIRYNTGNGTDLSRIRFHLRDEEIKKDLRTLLEHERAQYFQPYNRCQNEGQFDMDINDSINNAMYSQPSYRDGHISAITVKYGPLNDPQIGDPMYSRSHLKRSRKPTNYYMLDECDYNPSVMYNVQEVQFFVDNHLQKKENNEVPEEEHGNCVSIGNMVITHGSLVRINYLKDNATIDARVVSIKKNQLSAISILHNKRKRVWYKDLRLGKINIVSAQVFR